MNQHNVGRILKGVFSGLVTFLTGLSTILTGPLTFSEVRAGQWVSIALATVIAVGGTYGLAPWSGSRINGVKPDGQ